MVSYRDMTEAEIQAYREKSRKEYEENYAGRVDPKTGRWLKQEDATNAVFSNVLSVPSSQLGDSVRSPSD